MGLAPLLIHEIFNIITRLNEEEKISILLVEQNAKLALNVAPYAYVMESGRVVMDDTADKTQGESRYQGFLSGIDRRRGKKKFPKCQTLQKKEKMDYLTLQYMKRGGRICVLNRL